MLKNRFVASPTIKPCWPIMMCRARVATRDSDNGGDNGGDDHERSRKVWALNRLMYMEHKDLTPHEIHNMLEGIGGKTTRFVMCLDLDTETMEMSLIIDRLCHPSQVIHDDNVTIEVVNDMSASEKVRKELTSSLLLWGKSLVFPIKIPLGVFFHGPGM